MSFSTGRGNEGSSAHGSAVGSDELLVTVELDTDEPYTLVEEDIDLPETEADALVVQRLRCTAYFGLSDTP